MDSKFMVTISSFQRKNKGNEEKCENGTEIILENVKEQDSAKSITLVAFPRSDSPLSRLNPLTHSHGVGRI